MEERQVNVAFAFLSIGFTENSMEAGCKSGGNAAGKVGLLRQN